MRIVAALVVALLLVVTGAPGHAAKGDPSDWTRLPGEPRWDPCTTIRWSYPGDGSVMEQAMVRAVRKVAKFSGLRFERVGEGELTAVLRPTADIAAYVQGVAYADNRIEFDGTTQWITGSVLNVGVELTVMPRNERKARTKRAVLVNVVMHELGHAVGLGHAATDSQVMWAAADGQRQYGAGDRTGLAVIGQGPCRVWSARTVDTEGVMP